MSKKPFLMTWKEYAEKLEKDMELNYRTFNWIEKTDNFIGGILRFPDVSTLVKYIELKVEINAKISARILCKGEASMISLLPSEAIETMAYLKEFKKVLEEHIKTNRILKKITVG